MIVTNIYPQSVQPSIIKNKQNNSAVSTANSNHSELSNAYYTYGINFRGLRNTQKTVPDIDFDEYKSMKEPTKQRYRKVYQNFDKNPSINKNDLVDSKYLSLPLQTEKKLNDFIDFSKIYLEYKKNPIICLGRSPKWFLNTALWMKDGIDPYTFVAFSKYWYIPDKIDGARKLKGLAPTPEEETAYKKYLKSIQADPKSIVEKAEKAGEKVVITDYIQSGKECVLS